MAQSEAILRQRVTDAAFGYVQKFVYTSTDHSVSAEVYPKSEIPPRVIRLSNRDRDTVLALVTSNEEPGENLIRAAENYKRKYR